MAESYWRIPRDEDPNLEIPLHALKVQAELLTEQTGGLLLGIVGNVTIGDSLLLTMSIRVPTLNSYSVELLDYRQPPAMFPGNFEFNFPPTHTRVETYQQFVATLRDYLSSTEVSKVVRSLLVQAKA